MDHSKARIEELKNWGVLGEEKFEPMLRKRIIRAKVKVIERTIRTSLLTVEGQVVGAAGFTLHEGELSWPLIVGQISGAVKVSSVG